ncbi:MarR family winged helix-turn-helix transcriptional regulator [Actinocorallia sp. API 0066]|uniref:MarR family winged helix-turn-helix transcriptional regulator n=1 Tax=Actinocorallia sp. API 0066 TaxID=2896846 RepID=UPI001E2F4DA7|nr:MarR family winged helix-turn-helix transcriptional regulator [Actinocorallia sp. API 0066]MCD0449567.1 MarR family winged helix-turn-helix transcriptional regulator [Actinocorallia sp. API 0066]
MTRWLSDLEQHAWRGLMQMHAEVWAAVTRDLQADSGLSAGDYAVLVPLSEQDDHRLRVTELARAMRWERSRLSHQLSRMEKRGLIVRRECPEDARGAFAEITEHGRTVITTAAPHHVASVRRHFFDALTPERVAQLSAISDAVLAGLGGPDGPDGPGGSEAEPCPQSSSDGMNGST